jgi:hypothetical protein
LNNMLAWHYTVGLKLPLIRESGCLRPTDVGIGPDERPVLWFSTAPYWEPTSARMRPRSSQERLAAKDSLPFHRLSMQENAELGEGLYRFGLPVERLIRWPEIGKRAGIRAPLRNALMRAGRLQGAEPSQWYGTFREIPIEDLLFQQLVNFRQWEAKEEKERRENQLAQIASLEIPVRLVPLALLRKTALDDRACVNHIRHRLTNYHRLLERFDAGDIVLLNAIRTRVYSAISAAYPELAQECDRQLADRFSVASSNPRNEN